MAATLTDPLIGHVVDGRYEVLSRIARGGMATVYLAVDRRLDREVALKVMHPHLADGGGGGDFVARFRREARAAARLSHPGLVGVFDQGVDGETSYLTMEYVAGTNLRRRLADEGALPVGEALAVAEAVLEALSAAHRADMVHRDVKPENVLLADDGRVKVADFGLARAVTEVSSTTTGTVFGTVAYLSPELVAHGTADTRTDVYAVGVMLFETLTGRQPFTGATPIQVAYRHVHEDVSAPSDVVDWLPVEVDELVQALAARDPADRPAEAMAALSLLRRTRAALDPATLERRAERPDAVAAVDGDVDPDATASLGRPGDLDAAGAVPDTEARGRTVALPVGAAMEPPAHGSLRRFRRRAAIVLATIALIAVTGFAGIWYATAGPGAWTSVPVGLVGAERSDAEAALEQAGLGSRAAEVFDPEAPAGTVVDAVPAEGERIERDGEVTLAVSKGPDLKTVPGGLVGSTVDDATAALEDVGLVVPEPLREHHDTAPAGQVLGVSAAAGEQLPVGTEVVLTVSDGPAPVDVPDVVGSAAGEAREILERDGLQVQERQDFSEQFAEGLVMAQSPQAGASGLRGDLVTITVSQGPPLVEVPRVMGQKFKDAAKVLEELGLTVERRDYLGAPGGFVLNQSIDPGTSVRKGSTVVLTVF